MCLDYYEIVTQTQIEVQLFDTIQLAFQLIESTATKKTDGFVHINRQ